MTESYNTLPPSGPLIPWKRAMGIKILLEVQKAIDGLGLEASLPASVLRRSTSGVWIIVITVWARPVENYLDLAVTNISQRLNARNGGLHPNWYEGKRASFQLPDGHRFWIEIRGIGAFAPSQKKRVNPEELTPE